MKSGESTMGQDSEFLVNPDDLKQLIASSDKLVMLPTVAVEAMALSNDPNCSISEFVQLIKTDAGLPANISFMSNRAAYGTKSEIKDVRQAVVSIGTTQCQDPIVSSCVRALSQKLPASVEWSRHVLWQHNIQAATIARYVNKKLKTGFEGEEFSAAMIHDVGRLLIAAAAPDVFDAVDRLSFCEGANTIQNEKRLIGTDHCELGAIFVESSGLPQSFVDVVRFHHSPMDARSNSRLVHLVAAADHIANHLMHSASPDEYDVTGNPGMYALLEESQSLVDPATLASGALLAFKRSTASNTA